jgi:hypothetical protein
MSSTTGSSDHKDQDNPAQRLIAGSERAQRLTVGSHGRGGIRRPSLGSCSTPASHLSPGL